VSDQLGSDHVIGDFEGIDRADPSGGETGIDAVANSLSEREMDPVLSGHEWHPFAQSFRGRGR
jgi:hypothetical protein